MQKQVVCPKNIYLCNNDIYNILNKIKKNESKIKCANNFCANNFTGNNCDCLFNKIVDGKITCGDLYGILDKETDNEIKNQIIYNLNQLVQLKLKLKATKNLPPFGTYDWWLETIWGPNKIQNYIYIISFVIAAIGIIYFTWTLFQDIYITFINIIGIEKSWTILGLILTVIFIFIFTIIFMDYSFSRSITYSKPNCNNYKYNDKNYKKNSKNYVECNNDEYPNNIRNNFSENLTNNKIALLAGLPAGFAFLVITIIIILCLSSNRFGIDNKDFIGVTFRFLGYISLLILIAFIVIFNIYFTFLIPQLLILGIILQKFIFKTASFSNFNILLFTVPLFLIIFNISYVFIINKLLCVGTPSESDIDKCTGKNIENKEGEGYFIAPYTFLLSTILILTFFSYISQKKSIKFDTDYTNNSWGLYLSPLIKIIAYCISNKK